jgi:hypothetical protein
VGSRHQKRPYEKTGKADLHAEADAVAMAEAPVVKRAADQESSAGAERPSVHKPIRQQKDERNCRNRRRMTQGDRLERDPDNAPILPVERKGHVE